MKAWLVRWEWDGEHVPCEGDKIAAILNPRLSGQLIAGIVELLHVNAMFSISERIAYAKDRKRSSAQARFNTISTPYGHMPSDSQVFCGDNPYLYARRVNDLKVYRDENGNEVAAWKDIPLPSYTIEAR